MGLQGASKIRTIRWQGKRNLVRAEAARAFALDAQERPRRMPVDTLRHRFHNPKRWGIDLKERQKSLEHVMEEAVSRALRDNLAPLQRTADELHQAYADLVAACSSSRPSNALPAMLRAQTAASALAAGLSVLSNFVAVALNPRDREVSEEPTGAKATAVVELEPEPEAPAPPKMVPPPVVAEPAPDVTAEEVAVTEAPSFDLAALPADQQELHRRANRVAKVAMQDIKLLRPKDVRLGREHRDICHRLRSELDKARKEYDRRFRTILDHPIDYFHHWMVEILAGGDSAAVGEYPYPSPVLRH
jgi:hypothetical protein